MLNNNRTVTEVLDETFREYADNAAFTCLGHTLSYAELDRLSAQFAHFLQNCTDLKPGDRIALQMPNILQYPVALYGALRAGLVIVNTNPLYTAREIKHQLNDSGAKALVVLANIADTAAKVIADTPVKEVIVTEIADLHPPLKRVLINTAVKYLKKMVPSFSYPNQITWRTAMRLGASGQFQAVARAPEDILALQYTGGTTGVAKGAMLTHRNLVSNMEQVLLHVEETLNKGADVFVAPLPLYHIYAFNLHCVGLASVGCHSILIPNPRDIPSVVKALRGHRITGFVGLNTLFNALVRDPGFRDLDFSALRITSSGGMALTEDAASKWKEVTGIEPSEGYGLTETSPTVSSNPPGAIQRGTVGTPLPETELKIIDEQGRTLPAGEAGELCVRGPQVMKGYWQRPEATAEILDGEGWLKTGDMAVLQEDGYLRIVDRKKDMIIVSGFNVYPNEIEDVVCQHPAVLEAAAIGVADEKSGEAVKLFVVVSDSAVTAETIRDYCRENLTAYKVPRFIEFSDDLPKSNVGKILRRELKEKETSAAA
nr:AMP-binding protein [Exilibacterium tricleocarpae]